MFNFEDKHAIKSIKFDHETKAWAIKKAIEEYSLYLIASNLKIGPKITRLFGFDLIVYENCIEFSMEKCSKPLDLDKNEILHHIKVFHELKIIHGDIKLENIMYSH